jgi:predicted alpha/beta hydrolase family esterase
MTSLIYYLPGHGGHLETGLGAELMSRGYDVTGRETRGEFKSLPFASQVDLVAQDLSSMCWTEDAYVVANSFGAYLFLHAQAQLSPYIGKVLLLSPIVGEFAKDDPSDDQDAAGWLGFIPPMAKKLFELIDCGAYPAPKHCEIHVGANDWQSNPLAVTSLGRQLAILVCVIPEAGHGLPKAYVSNLLDRWLAKT